MGFLSGVLSNIKEHLGQHKETLNETIDILNTNKHAGKNGFNAAIGRVVAGVRGYNEKVRESNQAVRNVIDTFTQQMKEIKASVSGISISNAVAGEINMAVSQVDAHMQTCLQQAQSYDDGMAAEKKNIDDLQTDLQTKINNASDAITYQYWRLGEVWKIEQLHIKHASELIETQLNAARNTINEMAVENIKAFVSVICEKISEIKQKLSDINGLLTHYVNELNEWITKADKVVIVALNKVEQVLCEATGQSKTQYVEKLKEAVLTLERKGVALYEAYEIAEKALPHLIKNVKTAVTGLDGVIVKGLQRLEGEIKEKLKEYIEWARVEFDEIKRNTLEQTSGGSDNSIQHNLGMLKIVVNGLIKKINGTGAGKEKGHPKHDGLEGIKERLKEYAQKLTTDAFAITVESWLNKILEKNDTVNMHIDWYIQSNNLSSAQRGNELEQKRKEVIADIIPKIVKLVKEGNIQKPAVSGNVASMLSEINRFHDEVAAAIEKGVSPDNANVIATEVEKKFLTSRASAVQSKDYLQSAIRTALAQLSLVVRKSADEIKAFTTENHSNGIVAYNLGKNVDDAISKANEIWTELTDDAKYGGKLRTALLTVKDKIKQLDKILTTEEVDNDIEVIMMDYLKADRQKLKTKMTDYNIYVESNGTLGKAIRQVHEKALDAFIVPVNVKQINISTIKSTAQLITTHITNFCDTIRNAADADHNSAKAKLLELRRMLAKGNTELPGGLEEFHSLMYELQTKHIRPRVDEAQEIVNDAGRYGNIIIEQLSEKITEQFDRAMSSITNHLKLRYAKFIASQLVEFADKVNKELEHLPAQIADDANKCYKGFMKELYDKAVLHLNAASQRTDVLLDFSSDVNIFFSALFATLDTNTQIMPEPVKITELLQSFGALFTGLSRFNRPFLSNLSSLSSLLATIRPASYADASNPLLECLRKGVQRMHGELEKAYVSVYDSETFYGELVKNLQHVSSTSDVNMKYDLTDEGTRLSKVFLTVLRTLDVSLHTLKSNCKSLPKKRINRDTDIGDLLAEQGYKVSDNGEQNGELQDRSDMTGEHILGRLIGRSGKVYSSHDDAREKGPLNTLSSYLKQYYDVCHQALRPKSRLPCNVHEMLVWFTGLPHHPVYEELLQNGLSAPFENPSKQRVVDDDGLELTLTDTRVESITAHPSNITYNSVNTALQHLCTKSYDLLTTVMGHGNAETVYAVDFHTNYFNLKYPTSGEECLQTILDILRRMLPPLRYLYYQCSLGTNHGGWAQCLYGRDIKTNKWPCKNHSTDEPKCQPNDKVTCRPNCQPTSPLMSYLGDCLTGHLPHKLTSIGCRSVCSTCPSVAKLGMPCVTPLGFRAFSGSTKTGRDIYEILKLLFGSGLVSSLLCLVPSPPSTLPEHFQFALALTHVLHNTKNATAQDVTTAFNTSINAVSIDLYKDSNKLTSALDAAYGSNQSSHDKSKHNPKSADMSSLSMDESCMLANEDNVNCGPYLQTLFCDSYHYLAKKHCNLYLSWAVYLPWSLYSYLKSLFDSHSSISCQDWGCSRCVDGISCRPGKHGDIYSCRCRSLVGCRGVLSTLYNYGFTFGDAEKLLSDDQRRYCRNLYAQLQNVLTSQHFTKLFEECDNFIWTIRQPFTYLVLALWSLSLFYLICVMVGRLDVLHIRSHLRIPSSHKITAQSLLAAAQVGRLAKISYLQP
ncbi:hypothetical protein, conserved [Babesia bigemina]|uniref:C3H1-type domain-containing protein n=1 Tax=Babesia bigemina TaxID=5866 RepID=A0A061BJ49_BABBI|nr:hypothetical protein, conserved [Babesia bigemina]CDR71501.1 hypothetical protein, conserved [Babesia bigemina]|eukprot:XP_012770447.1 hypothetical protein, conserved [Babesia bigemina]